MGYDVQHIIGGQTFTPTQRKLDIYNPATGDVIGQVGVANQEMVAKAVAAAKAAFVTWSQTTPSQRAKIIFKFKALLDAEIKNLAAIVTREHGKTLEEAAGSVQRGIDVVDFTCGITNLLKGAYTANVGSGVDSYSLHQPLGVCVGITPFNFPAMIPLWMFPMAIACGNTFVLKPSERDPSCSQRLVELAKAAGVPDGVVNLVHGDKETVDALITHPDVKAVSFVGSTPVAEHVYKTAIQHNKRAQAFGGAKNHCLVMPDANLMQTAENITTAAYGSAGERCMAISVAVVVGDKTADKLLELIQARIKKIIMGPGDQDKVELGPVVTKAHCERVLNYIEIGKQEGAKLMVDGSQHKKIAGNGFFIAPYLFDHVKPSMRIYKEEIFGPVLCIVRVKDFNEGLQLITDHEFGNGTAIFTNDGYYAREFAERVQVGMVGINVPVPVPVAYHSFGGWKRSIFADIGMYGMDAVRFYTKLKTVTTRWFKGENT